MIAERSYCKFLAEMLKPRGQTGRPRSRPRPWPQDPFGSFWPRHRNLIAFSYETWCPWLSEYAVVKE